jgi:hypothetical protein
MTQNDSECRMPVTRSRPRTVPELLRELHVNDVSVANQKFAIASWLTDYRPSRDLVLSLRANGYGLLLPPIVRRRGPVTTTGQGR